ncbi:hypothetical protein [Pseudoalteromonas luteoviolacea]|uniref:VCBS repeat-containing protein n=1 Tax=Pseudoalteromonas luteoviolacea S4054 TaxID=1129367 RepID=A0A0F6AAU9_9GAMM|nr:hypothetical protein [Pseudoalteromonas luteoviolacea]AOT08650.1 hypothetical protein S4054249_12645 [Pseudoalteromonas luteoviolacea]AOT13565.1 hypothetical protein S40542_12620 [Pseudoalteromonas luteoviolacea]AOT18478.1 hypothetical protein S4054_12620 [Pseudoalteromonas luteoviolacea]KKE82524.1 hypothetical protein N479_18120 [Pseudoalteromonas luteoviolacea S4054]KZN72061.1 hypothetical protein N481_16755 [Pseudoalteromonas luteoviolacea S4047-1]
MKIESAQIEMRNKHESQFHVSEQRTEVMIPDEEQSALPMADAEVAKAEQTASDMEMGNDAKLYILKLLVQKLTGKEVSWYDDTIGKDVAEAEAAAELAAADAEQLEPTHVIIERLSHEQQSNVFKAGGQITLQNGEQIAFAFKSVFEQSHTSYERTIEDINMKDPLIISFTNKAVELDSEQMQFDIDADGKADTFSHLKKGYGFLALDLNNNSRIDDGTELFGALSGNGFADLAQYDQDGNGFIDENDEVFDSLRVWIKNKDEDKLVTLSEANIGAIGLQNAETPLNIREQGELKGAIRKSGFYLDEQGKPSLVQQIDYVV